MNDEQLTQNLSQSKPRLLQFNNFHKIPYFSETHAIRISTHYEVGQAILKQSPVTGFLQLLAAKSSCSAKTPSVFSVQKRSRSLRSRDKFEARCLSRRSS